MPRITISEKDLTVNNEVDVLENVVFIPGISTKPVEDRPVRYDSIESFMKHFGNTPYRFIHAQDYVDAGNSDAETNTTHILGANEYERSYIYASELLTSGMSVYFYNVVNIYDCVYFAAIDNVNYKKDTYYKISEADVGEVTSTTYKPYTYLILKNTKYVYASGEFDETETYYTLELSNDDTANPSLVYYEYRDDDVIQTYYDRLMSSDNNPFQPALDRWTYNVKFITCGGYPVTVPKTDTTSTSSTEVVDDDTNNNSGNGTVVDAISTVPNLSSVALNAVSDAQSTGNATYPIPQTMLMAATYRADADVLIDDLLENSLTTTYNNINRIFTTGFDFNFYKGINNPCNLTFTAPATREAEDTRKYGQVIAPSGVYYTISSNLVNAGIVTIRMPGSFAYLRSFVNSVSVLKNPDYYAIAGVSRGLVPSLQQLIIEPTGSEGEDVQSRDGGKISINPILYVQNYGHCIWGNRTLFPNPLGDLAASSFANIRLMSSDVKKVIYNACRELTFETNGIELWLKFKAKVEPLLEQMVANGALDSFELLRKATSAKATLAVYVKLVTEYAVEDFDITIGLTDTTVEQAE